jgi:hypothetical protein
VQSRASQAARYLARIAQLETFKVDSMNSSPVCEEGSSPFIEEDRIAALIDALNRNPRITATDLGPLIRQELARTPTLAHKRQIRIDDGPSQGLGVLRALHFNGSAYASQIPEFRIYTIPSHPLVPSRASAEVRQPRAHFATQGRAPILRYLLRV